MPYNPLDDRSEYDGGGVMPNTVYPKGNDALTPSDKLRLQSITGQEEDSRAPVDPGFWYGNGYFDPNEKPPRDREAERRRRQERRKESRRYRETPR